MRKEETIALAIAFQAYTVQLGTPQGTMWSSAGALPMSCPLPEGDGLLNLEMLDIAEKDPVARALASPTPEPKEERQIIIQVPKEPCTSEPEEAAHLAGGLDYVWERFLSVPLGFAQLHTNQTHAGLARGIPQGA